MEEIKDIIEPADAAGNGAGRDYKYGFVTDIETDVIPVGLSEDVVRHAYYAVCFDLSDEKLQALKDEELTLAIEYPDHGKYSTVTYTYVLSELPQTDWQTMHLLMTGNAPDADRAAYEQAIAEYLP